MSKTSDMPRDFEDALSRCARSGRRTIANNTTVEVAECDPRQVILRLHGHPIAMFEPGAVRVDSCGWRTVTTKQRLNAILATHGVRVYAKDYAWRLWVRDVDTGEWTDGGPFEDGERFLI